MVHTMMGNGAFHGPKSGARIGPYRIVRVVRTSEDESLSEARHETSHEMVALKLARGYGDETTPEIEAAVQDLATKLSAVSSPHLVPAQEVSVIDGWGLSVTAPIHGLLLADELQDGIKFSPTQALRVATDMATGLETLHGAGVYHGNLTPENVVLARQNRAQLIGVGIFAAVNPPGDTPAARSSLPYWAPERYRYGASALSDLYSLGLVFYELLTGRQAAATVAGYQPGARSSLVPRPPAPFSQVAPHLPRALETLCFSLLQIEPDERCQSAADFRARVHQLIKSAQRRRTPRPAR